jgi:hypothetical protein
MKKLLTLLLLLTSITLSSQVRKGVENNTETYNNDFPAYVIYNQEGERVTYTQMVNSIITADIMLFGELHDDPISHWLELSLLKTIHSIKGDKLVVGAEMWESDNQLIMDEMLVHKLVDGKSYTESSKLWPNFATDYQPILQYVKSKNLPFICTNIPRRYARIVFQKGVEYLDSLSDQAKSYFPPLPIHFDLTQPAYQNMARIFPTDEEFEMKQQQESKSSTSAMHGSKPSNLIKAQAIKDATMAYFILKNWKPGLFFYHFNGEYHSAFHDSIVYYLRYYSPGINVKTISIIKQASVMNFDKKNSRADFNIVVPSDMTVTYISKPF